MAYWKFLTKVLTRAGVIRIGPYNRSNDMKDKTLERQLLDILHKLDRKIDYMEDTPKRHAVSALISAIVVLIKAPNTAGY